LLQISSFQHEKYSHLLHTADTFERHLPRGKHSKHEAPKHFTGSPLLVAKVIDAYTRRAVPCHQLPVWGRPALGNRRVPSESRQNYFFVL